MRYRVKVRNGYHRYYASVAVGFTKLPVVVRAPPSIQNRTDFMNPLAPNTASSELPALTVACGRAGMRVLKGQVTFGPDEEPETIAWTSPTSTCKNVRRRRRPTLKAWRMP
jgi:hypothetical protein